MGNSKNKTPKSTSGSTNDDSAEAAAMVTAAPPPPAPLLAIAMADPNAIDNVKRRAAETTAKRGRSSLRIPLNTASGNSTGGIAIPL